MYWRPKSSQLIKITIACINLQPPRISKRSILSSNSKANSKVFTNLSSCQLYYCLWPKRAYVILFIKETIHWFDEKDTKEFPETIHWFDEKDTKEFPICDYYKK